MAVPMLSLGNLDSELVTLLWENTDSPDFWGPTERKTAIKRAYRKLWGKLMRRDSRWGIKMDETNLTSLVADTELITAPEDFVSLVAMDYYYNARWIRMTELHNPFRDREHYDENHSGYITDSGIPPYRYYHLGWENSTPTAPTYKFGIRPIPKAAISDCIRWTYHWQPSMTMDDADLIILPDSIWESLCILEAINWLYIKDQSVFQNMNWQKDLAELREEALNAYRPASKDQLVIIEDRHED